MYKSDGSNYNKSNNRWMIAANFYEYCYILSMAYIHVRNRTLFPVIFYLDGYSYMIKHFSDLYNIKYN